MYRHIETSSEPISLSFAHVNYEVKHKKERKVILSDISGHVPAGTFLAILGSSGAGKSTSVLRSFLLGTLLDVLAGRNKTGKVTGSLLFNGEPRPSDFHLKSAYVMQDDALMGNLTVEETLRYVLQLRIPKSELNEKQRKLRISSLLADLNLTKVKNSRVGTSLHRGISGGERRRLGIAVEMVTGPKIVFLDEPTTGLDSHNALRVMKSLKNLCVKHQVTIICTVHQPRSNIFHLFDNVLLLDGGRTVYYGPDPVSYFGGHGLVCPQYMNPADFLLDIILQGQDETNAEQVYAMEDDASCHSMTNFDNVQDSDWLLSFDSEHEPSLHPVDVENKYSTDELKDMFAQSEVNQKLLETTKTEKQGDKEEDKATLNLSQKPRVSKFKQMRVLLARTWKGTIRDSNVMYIRTFAAVFIALLVGVIYFQLPDDSSSNGNRLNSILFLMCVFSLFCLPAISKFIEERLVFTREHASGYYSTLPYWIASFLVELPILFCTVIIYGTISYWMVGFQPGFLHFAFFLAIVFVVIQVAYAACQVIASNVKTVNVAIALYVMFLLYSLLLGGFLIHQDTLPPKCQWMVYTSYFYYGFAALTVNEFEEKPYGQSIITGLNLENVHKNVNLIVLVCMWFVLKFIEYICLRFFTKEKK